MDYSLLIVLAIVLFGGVLGGLLATKFKVSFLVGYIVFGLLLGLIFTQIKAETDFVLNVAEVGVFLLLFILGLEFSLNGLKFVGKNLIIGAILQLLFVILVFSLILPPVLGIDNGVALFVGGIFAISSTAVVVKLLSDRGELESRHGELILAWLIVQAIAVVPIVLILPELSQAQDFEFVPVIFTVAKSLVAIYLLIILSKKTVPFLFKKLALYGSKELLLVSSIMVCVVVSLVANLFGLPFAVGAFLSGVLLSTSAVNHEVFTEIKPLKDLFSSVFFVSLGFLLSLGVFFNYFFIALVVALLIIVVKVLVVLILAIFFNYHSKLAFLTSAAMFQIGELSFILALVGLKTNILTTEVFHIIVASSIITIILTSPAYSFAPIAYKSFRAFVKSYVPVLYNLIFNLADSDAKMPRPRKFTIKNHVILIGFGGVGAHIGKVLSLTNIPYIVIDLHFKTLQDLRKRGIFSIYGDAANKNILDLANISQASAVVITVPNIVSNELILNSIRSLNPGIQIIMRSHLPEDTARLSIRGIKHIIEPEFEAALSISSTILKHMNFKTIPDILNQVRRDRKY